MPTIEIEVGEDGSVVKVPEPVQKLIDKAFGQGRSKAADELAKQPKVDPVERERLKTLEQENSELKEREARLAGRYDEAIKINEERAAKELKEERSLREEEKLRAERLREKLHNTARESLRDKVSALALAAGVRNDAVVLRDFSKLAMEHIEVEETDDGFRAFIRDEKDPGKHALSADGKTPLSLEGFIDSFLAIRPSFRAAPAGRGGGATGGRSLNGSPLTGVAADKAEAFDAVAQQPTITNLARAFSRVGKDAA